MEAKSERERGVADWREWEKWKGEGEMEGEGEGLEVVSACLGKGVLIDSRLSISRQTEWQRSKGLISYERGAVWNAPRPFAVLLVRSVWNALTYARVNRQHDMEIG